MLSSVCFFWLLKNCDIRLGEKEKGDEGKEAKARMKASGAPGHLLSDEHAGDDQAVDAQEDVQDVAHSRVVQRHGPWGGGQRSKVAVFAGSHFSCVSVQTAKKEKNTFERKKKSERRIVGPSVRIIDQGGTSRYRPIRRRLDLQPSEDDEFGRRGRVM